MRQEKVRLASTKKEQCLVTAVTKVVKTRVALMLLSSDPVDITFVKQDRKIGRILWVI